MKPRDYRIFFIGVLLGLALSNAIFARCAELSINGRRITSIRVEGGYSSTRFDNAGDNIWYDQTYPHANNLTANGWAAGLAGDLSKHIGWRLWRVEFGQTSNSAVWPDDPDYFAHDGAPAKWQGKGQGDVKGWAVGPTFNYRITPRLTATAEAGALFFGAHWDEAVRLIADGPKAPWIDAATFSDAGKSQRGDTYYWGIGFTYGPLLVAYRRYTDIHVSDSLFGNSAKQLVIGGKIEF